MKPLSYVFTVVSDSRLAHPVCRSMIGKKKMIRNAKLLLMTILLLAADCSLASGQQPLNILTIDVQNVVEYQGDVSDPTKFAINPGVTPSGGVKEFGVNVVFGDIVAVNGQP